MPSSDRFHRRTPRRARPALRASALVLAPLLLLGGCTHLTPDQLAYRDRLEGGFVTPEDTQCFCTPDAQRLARQGDVGEREALRATPADAALLRAVADSQVASVKALLAQGALVNAADTWGTTPLLAAARAGDLEVVRLLLKAGADVNGRGGAMTPLAAAALQGNAPLVNLLLQHQADTEQRGANELTPLLDAVTLNQVASAATLVAHGASYRTLNPQGETVLQIAVRDNQPALLTALLDQGVPADLRDRDGHSALYWARYFHRDDLAAVLRARGADAQQLTVEVRHSLPYNFREF